MELNASDNQTPGIPRENLLAISVGSALLYLVIAWLIFRFIQGEALQTAFEHGLTITTQLWISILSGGAAAAVIAFLINRWPISEVLYDYYIVRALSNSRFRFFDCLHLSLFAGVGEELLFRGAIQPLLGIWITSLLFVGVHGYFKFRKFGHYAFGLMMFALSVMLGYIYEEVGLMAAMVTHAAYDLIMLQLMKRRD